jgi:hypothetical protein
MDEDATGAVSMFSNKNLTSMEGVDCDGITKKRI